MKFAVILLIVLTACGSSRNPTAPDAGPADAGPGADAPLDAAALGDPFAALLALPAACSTDRWCWRAPRPAGNDYSRVFATAPDNLWLIGQHGTVMQWNGQAWTSHHLPVPDGQPPGQFPFSISGRGPSDMWLIFGNTVQHWDGAAWTIRDSLPPSGVIAFNSIWEAPGGEVWVTMNTGTVRRSQGGGAFQQLGTGCNNCFLGSIWGLAADDFFITTLPAGILHYDGHAFVRTYDGPVIAGSYQGSRGDVWVSGADGALLHWNGAAWTPVATGLGEDWYVGGVAALASDDVWWWASRSSARSALLHWDGKAIATTPIDTTKIGASLYSGAIVDGRWWLVGGAGAIYTRSGGALQPVVDPGVMGLQSIWGSSETDLYFATGGELRHWDGKATAEIPIAANAISGIRAGDVDELFATGFDLSSDRTEYIASAYHLDGATWSKTPLDHAPVQQHRYFSTVFAIGPGEAMAVGYGGIAYRHAGGTWTPVATGVTEDLRGVWGPDADHLWITGSRGTLLTWSRDRPDVATPDPSLPPTADDLGAIHGAGGIVWIAAGADRVLQRTASGWTTLSTGVAASGIFAVSATDVVVASAAQSVVARWNGREFVREDNASGMPTPVLFQPPGGPMLAGGLDVLVEHR